jgi:hypothetical protein
MKHLVLFLLVVAGCGSSPEAKAPEPQVALQATEFEGTEMTLVEKPRTTAAEEKPLDVPEPVRMSKRHAPLVVLTKGPAKSIPVK